MPPGVEKAMTEGGFHFDFAGTSKIALIDFVKVAQDKYNSWQLKSRTLR